MQTLASLKRGQGIWVDHHGAHPAVVLVEGETSIQVICGTSKQKPDPDEVCVKPGSPASVALGLSAPTYFYPFKVAIICDAALVLSVKSRCPPNVFHRLEELAEIGALRAAEEAAKAAQRVERNRRKRLRKR